MSFTADKSFLWEQIIQLCHERVGSAKGVLTIVDGESHANVLTPRTSGKLNINRDTVPMAVSICSGNFHLVIILNVRNISSTLAEWVNYGLHVFTQ